MAVGTVLGDEHPWLEPPNWVLIPQSCPHVMEQEEPATGHPPGDTGEPTGGWQAALEAPASPRGGGSWGWSVMKAGFGV